MPSIDPSQIDTEHYWRTFYTSRQRGRTDLLWLCNEILGYKDVCQEVHGPIIDSLQKFKGGIDYTKPDGSRHHYEPACSMWALEGPRNRLLLYPRLHLKTTCHIAHKIQWILNYPDVRILLNMATGDQVTATAMEVLNHFRYNEKLRFLYPEFCPPLKSAKDFGSLEGFTVQCRTRKALKEPTLSTASVERTKTGMHYEVIWCSDLVTEHNVITPNQIRQVNDHIDMLEYLIERNRPNASSPPRPGWFDVEGTIYSFDDFYSKTQEAEEQKPETERDWFIIRHTAYKNNQDFGSPLWPAKFTEEALTKLKDSDPYKFSCQMLLHPIPQGTGLATAEDIKFAPRRILRSLLSRMHMTVDLAGMEPQSRGDFSVLNVHGFDRDGRMAVLEVLAKHLSVFEVIDVMFGLCDVFKQIQDIKVEKDSHARVLLPFLRREQEKRKKYLPPIIPLQRDNQTAKKQRIGGLQSWFKAGLIRFADEITSKLETIQEISRFSSTSTYHDDILDTLADAMQNRDGGVTYDVYPGAEKEWARPGIGAEHFLGFDPITHMDKWAGDHEEYPWCDPRTGL